MNPLVLAVLVPVLLVAVVVAIAVAEVWERAASVLT